MTPETLALYEKLLQVAAFAALLLPLGGFIVLAFFGDAIKREKEEAGAGILACVTVLLAFACSVASVWLRNQVVPNMAELRTAYQLAPRPEPYLPYQSYPFGTLELNWIEVAGLRVPFALLLDQLSLVMMLIVTGVGSLIHIYSLGYMAHDQERVRFFSYLNLFTFFMLLLVMGSSLPLLLVGWEGVGLCSYLLIGFWFKKQSAADAGTKAFIVNRIGDAGLLLGSILALYTFGSFDLIDITETAAAKPGELGVITAICLLLFLGACGKSAQVPLHVWLPDAMEGPTPVSALIHAATMVTAGVYLVARLAPLFARSTVAMTVVAVVGTVTALMAATMALVQTDIKRVLAYSTISQLGYMFLACGVGAFGIAIFHLFTHAFFKALLFLGAGSIIHALAGEQDLRRMGGLARRMPWTFATFLIGTLAIAGIPPLAGFVSKDAILREAYRSGRTGLFAVALLTALLTAYYMARLLFLAFSGSFRGDSETSNHVHESPWTMRLPLVLLAVGAASAGAVHVPRLLVPVLRLEELPYRLPHPRWLSFVATTLAVAGIAAAFYLCVLYGDLLGRYRRRWALLQRVVEAKYGFDRAYGFLARRVIVEGGTRLLWKRIDAGVIDRLVDGTAGFFLGLGRLVRFTQTGLVRAYLLVFLGGAGLLLASLLWFR